MGVAELRRVKQLEEENRRPKQVVADLTLDKAMLQDVLQKRPEGVPSPCAARLQQAGEANGQSLHRVPSGRASQQGVVLFGG